MDRNTVIGLVLIFVLFFVWAQLNSPSDEELAEQQRTEQEANGEQADKMDTSAQQSTESELAAVPQSENQPLYSDSVVDQRTKNMFGPFYPAALGEEKTVVLENELFIVSFSNKGGVVSEVELKEYDEVTRLEDKTEIKSPVKFHNSEKNRFNYVLPVSGTMDNKVNTADLYFEVEQLDNRVIFKAPTDNGGYFVQEYSIEPGSYNISYNIRAEGLDAVLSRDAEAIELQWENWLNRIELNTDFEKTYSTVYFRPTDANPDYCSCRSDDLEVEDKNIQWFSHANQFFNSSLLAKTQFGPGQFETQMLEDGSESLKVVRTKVSVPLSVRNPNFDMDFYIGPNEFKNLRSYGVYLEDIIPFGTSIFGSINRWIIRPMFTWLSGWIASAGLVIFMLTLIVKLLMYPLTYKMLHSQSKMGALKPEMAQLKEKHKDDQQQQQVETMKLYREFGVNPLGGCLPMLLQMPIWFALYRFFPAAIEFRQEGFWWATDLSSYDAFFWLPFEIPFYGEHVSMFTLLWAVTTVAYTYYNTKMMDMTGAMNPMMKYMQYFMPLMFIVFFNSFAAGLACYLFFSNVLNVSMIIVTKNYLIDHDKIRRKMDEYRTKPKKKTGFGARLEKAMKEQQKIQAQKKNK